MKSANNLLTRNTIFGLRMSGLAACLFVVSALSNMIVTSAQQSPSEGIITAESFRADNGKINLINPDDMIANAMLCETAGALDTAFDGDGKATTVFGSRDDKARAVVVQPDGKIVVAGYAYINTYPDFALARYNADGSLDPTFDGDGKVTTPVGISSEVYALALQPDGKIVAAGYASFSGSNTDFALVRYNADGSRDTTFDSDGRVTTPIGSNTDIAHAVALQPDGKIVVAGYVGVGNAPNFSTDIGLARYNTDGSLDTGFDTDGRLTSGFPAGDVAYAVAVQSGGKIIVVGEIGADFGLLRFNANGSLDAGFDTDGKVTTDFAAARDVAEAAVLQPDGKIIAAGRANDTTENFALARYNTDGSLDLTFDSDGKVMTDFGGYDAAFAAALQADGKIIAAGRGSASGSPHDFALARYNTDGSPDTSFDTDGKLTTIFGLSFVQAEGVALQPDGKIVAAGYTRISSSDNDFALARYNNCAAAPTSAPVTVGGRVVNFYGRGVSRARVTLTDGSGATRSATTNPFGYYRFDEVAAGQTYILNAARKGFQFAAPQVLFVSEDLMEINFVALPNK